MPPVEKVIADEMIGHFQNDTTAMAETELTVPIANFVDPEHAKAEIEILKRRPLLIGRSSQIPKKGDFITMEVLGLPLIVVRKSDEKPAAYVNVCRHRGGKVEQSDCGNKRFFMCGYHGWSYSRDAGDLRGVPYDKFYTNVDRSRNSLHRVTITERHGFLWADLSGREGLDIDEWLGADLTNQLTSFGLSDLKTFLDKSFTLDINWKLVLDGAIDVLHPQFLHPTGVGKLITTNTSVWRDYGRHGQSFSPRMKLSDKVAAGEDLSRAAELISSNIFVYPNSMIISAPDHFEQWTVFPDPELPNRSTTRIRFLAPASYEGDEKMERRMAKSWEILQDAAMNEDWPMEEHIQRNSKAWSDGTYLYGRNEQACQHLHKQLASDLQGGSSTG